MDVLILLARLLLAGVFLVSGVAKLFDLAGSQKAMRDFGLPEPLARVAGIGLPIAELVVAVLLLPSLTAPWAAWGALVLLAAFIGGISYNLARGNTPNCHCFGQLQSEPIGRSTLIRNGVLAAIALFIGVAGFTYGPGPGIFEWTDDMNGLAWVVLVGGVIILAALGGLIWMVVHLLGQNGRLLVRLDRIEEALADADIVVAGDEDEAEQGFEEGLPFGSPAPAFSLTGLHGEQMTLAALRSAGNQVLLIFTDPNCGPCNALLPDIGTWQREHRSKLTVALISRGKPEAYLAKSAEHGLSNILLQQNNEVADAYQVAGTPTGLLIRADGTIGSGLAPGGDAIRRLVAQAIENRVAIPLRAAPRPAPRPAPAPMAGAEKIGSPAPEVSLPSVTGETVTLAQFKGEPTALLFWNPGCGFCQRMLPELKAWEENPPDDAPKLLVVSTGEAESNAGMGLKSPVVLDAGFNTGRAFGASGTPSALLINANGEIATGIAVGAPGVLGLLRGDAPAPVIFEDNEDDDEDAEPEGPPVGSPAPAVRLPDLDGNMVDLTEHQGTRTMLLFWNPSCGFCQRMLPDLKKWEEKPPKGAPKLVLVSSGSADENRGQGLRSLTLLDDDFSVGSEFGSDGTPSAIMIDAQGRVASSLVVGAPEVMKLAKTSRDPALPKPTAV